MRAYSKSMEEIAFVGGSCINILRSLIWFPHVNGKNFLACLSLKIHVSEHISNVDNSISYLHFWTWPKDDVLVVECWEFPCDNVTITKEVAGSLIPNTHGTFVWAVAGDVNDCRVLWILQLLNQRSYIWKKRKKENSQFWDQSHENLKKKWHKKLKGTVTQFSSSQDFHRRIGVSALKDRESFYVNKTIC